MEINNLTDVKEVLCKVIVLEQDHARSQDHHGEHLVGKGLLLVLIIISLLILLRPMLIQLQEIKNEKPVNLQNSKGKKPNKCHT